MSKSDKDKIRRLENKVEQLEVNNEYHTDVSITAWNKVQDIAAKLKTANPSPFVQEMVDDLNVYFNWDEKRFHEWQKELSSIKRRQRREARDLKAKESGNG